MSGFKTKGEECRRAGGGNGKGWKGGNKEREAGALARNTRPHERERDSEGGREGEIGHTRSPTAPLHSPHDPTRAQQPAPRRTNTLSGHACPTASRLCSSLSAPTFPRLSLCCPSLSTLPTRRCSLRQLPPLHPRPPSTWTLLPQPNPRTRSCLSQLLPAPPDKGESRNRTGQRRAWGGKMRSWYLLSVTRI